MRLLTLTVEARFGAAGEVEDLFHDAVEQIHFLSHDLDVSCARVIGGEFQVHRMKEQLHDRERIANLMRHLGREQAERGQFFILPELFLDTTMRS